MTIGRSEYHPNDTINNFTLISKITNKKWKCRCICGKELERFESNLRQKKSCGCLFYQYRKGKNNYLWGGYGQISGKFWSRVRANARARKIKFDLTIEQAWKRFQNQNGRCNLSGVELEFGNGRDGFSRTTASLDRIDPDKPYHIDNIQWLHKTINSMKWDLSQSRFVFLCKLVTSPLIHNQPSRECLAEWKKHPLWQGNGNISGRYWCITLQNATTRGIQFNLSIKEAWDKYKDQGGYCALTGLEIPFPKKSDGTRVPSLDRIDNTEGYKCTNVQWVHKDINRGLKRELDEEELKIWCRRVEGEISEDSKSSERI